MSQSKPPEKQPTRPDADSRPPRPACPVCGGRLIEMQGKLICSRCHTICETCCEGGQGG